MRKTLSLCISAILLAGCTWGINPTPASQNVRTVWSGDVSQCQDLGKITVSVMNRVGPVDRNQIKVQDELQVMARNQAADMHADTIKPLADPKDGEQPWGAYKCGSRAIQPAGNNNSNPAPGAGQSTKTFPIKGG
ncbi:MAG: DUF4156 domain-containing protein [Rhodanobacter sp.]|nr:MAG: DUF4156 domain-containing protein [Rhodanobacter sp.]TAM11118.1 MAG: DUF4156 domain-containing protein [Rhodanobacter sp.]TAM37631.1 MAG: DUF4156 domain-containing protein [Rhodanobacter sp.]